MLEAGDAHDRRHADGERGGGELRRVVEVHRAVLAVDEQPVEAGGLRQRGDVDGARLLDAQADGELARAQLAQGMVGDGAHGFQLLCMSVDDSVRHFVTQKGGRFGNSPRVSGLWGKPKRSNSMRAKVFSIALLAAAVLGTSAGVSHFPQLRMQQRQRPPQCNLRRPPRRCRRCPTSRRSRKRTRARW